jgi:hypothetical protein
MAIDFMNLFAPRGTPSALDALLTEDQRRLMGRNANLSAAAALLQASGPSRQRVGLGQALGAALQAGQQGYQQARAGSLQELMLGEKLRAGQDERQRDTDFYAMLRDAGQPAAAMPAAMPPAPGMARPGPTEFPVASMEVGTSDALRGGPIPEARMIPQPMAPAAAASSTNIFANLTPQQRTLLAGMPRKEATQFLLDASKPEPTPDSIRTLRALGLPQTVEGLRQLDKPEASPSEVRILQATGTPVTMENVMQLRKSGATNVSVGKGGVDLTPLQEARDKDFAKVMNEWVSGGGADMIGNVAQIGTVLQRLESGQQLTGPMIGIMPDLFLAITNPNAAGAKEQVQEVVQRNLRIVLGAQFTEKEGNQLISRAYNPTLPPAQNAARLRKLFQQMSVAAQQRQAMVDYATENGTLKGYRGPQPNINDFYKALEVRPIGLTDIEAELKRREAQR